MRLFLFVCLACLPLGFAFAAPLLERDLRSFDPGSPITGQIRLDEATRQDDRLRLAISGHFPNVLDELDQQMRQRGNMGEECGVRVFWTGPTRLRSGGEALFLTGRARFELWACARIFGETIKTKALQSTHDLDISLRPVWDPSTRDLWLDVRLDNIRDFPGEAEQILRRAGVRFSRRVAVPLGAPDRLQVLAPVLERLWFDPSGDRGAALRLELSADFTATIALLREETGIDLTSLLADSLRRFGGWLFGE